MANGAAWLTLTLAAALLTSHSALGQSERISKPGLYRGYSEARFDGHQMTSQYVAVRDGTRLAVDIFRPTSNGKVTDEKLPVLWMHTPYNRRTYANGLTAANYPGKALQLVKYGYVVAVADFRGLFASFGTNKGYNRGEWQDAARYDAYDITEWLAKQPWSSGKVGMWGCSATGGSQMQALSTAPPSLRAIFPMSCEWDVYPFGVPGGLSPPKGVPTQLMRGTTRVSRDKDAVPVDGDDDRKLLNAAIAEHKNNLDSAGYVPFRDSVSESYNNAWWLQSSPHRYADVINKSGIAVYAAANWDEGSTKYGAPFIFNNIKGPKKLILGPATHCDWTTVMKQTGFDIIVEEHRFFDYWLKDIDNGVMKERSVVYYTYNEAPEASWKTASQWPLPNEQRTDYRLAAGALTIEAKRGGSDRTSVTVDYEVDDKSFWQKGMVFTTEPLAADTEVTGHPVLKLWLSSSANDADVIARIDDVAPDGAAKYYNVEGKLRASLRKLEKAPYDTFGLPWHPFTSDSVQPLEADVPVELTLDVYPISYLFKQGHRIRLTLNFSDPRATQKLDPAPQVTVYHGGKYNSELTLPIIPRDAQKVGP